jgi:hypothetical protein
VWITDNRIVIGCQNYTTQEWAQFDDATIENMAPRAPEFLAQWKIAILAVAEAHQSPIFAAKEREDNENG